MSVNLVEGALSRKRTYIMHFDKVEMSVGAAS
jgi:hypothetical protein